MEQCYHTLGEVHNEDAFFAIERLIQASEQAGFTVPDLIRMLNGGMTLETLFDVIEVRMASAGIH